MAYQQDATLIHNLAREQGLHDQAVRAVCLEHRPSRNSVFVTKTHHLTPATMFSFPL